MGGGSRWIGSSGRQTSYLVFYNGYGKCAFAQAMHLHTQKAREAVAMIHGNITCSVKISILTYGKNYAGIIRESTQ